MSLPLRDLVTAAVAQWPGVTVDIDEVVRVLEAKRASADPPPLEPAAIAELALAVACARGDEAAIAAFDRVYLDVVPRALARMNLPAATVEDVRATVRDKLLLSEDDEPPRILDYAGRGRLRGLVQVTATRTAIDRIRHEEKEVALPADRDVAWSGDLARSLIEAPYREAFAAGFARAVAGASRRDRNLLRLHYLGGVTLEQLAQMYGVHRATVVRWLAHAREAVFDATREHVAATLGATPDELDGLFDLVRSRGELSVERLLASGAPREP